MNFKKVVVVGGGVLGSQIAFQAAYCGFEVVILLRSEDSIKRTKTKLETIKGMYLNYMEDMKKGSYYPKGITDKTKLSIQEIDELKKKVEKEFKEIKLTTKFEEACKEADLVIESITENKEQKETLFKKLSQYLEKKTILVTNTSTLLPSKLASFTGRPDKFLSLHFSNLIVISNIVEIMPHSGTDKIYCDIIEEFAKKIKMIPARLLKEQSGGIIHNLLKNFLKSGTELWVGDYAEPKTIDLTWKTAIRTPVGPFQIMDYIGINTLYNIRDMEPKSKENGTLEYQVQQKLKKMKDETKLGYFSGEGFYNYH